MGKTHFVYKWHSLQQVFVFFALRSLFLIENVFGFGLFFSPRELPSQGRA